MPINPNSRSRNRLTGASKRTAADQIVGLFGFIGLHEMAPVFEPDAGADGATDEPPRRQRGRKAAYPPISLLAVLVSGRATGSLSSALALLHEDRELWTRCVIAYVQRAGVHLPPVPPTRDQVIHFRDRLAGDPTLMQRLQLRFRLLAVGQAKRQGNLLPGIGPNGAEPLEAHAIYGDGTVIAKYSDLREITDPITGKRIVIGSRAKNPDPDRARIQRIVSDTFTEDNKNTNGLNMVAMHTWTTRGRITLGTGVALGGEAWAALELIESIHDIAGDGIHSVIYDRALTGWHVDHLMANLRIQVIGKAVGASTSRTDNEDQAWDRATDADIKDAVHRRAAEHGVKVTSDLSGHLRYNVIADMLRYHERLPLGLCIYPTSGRNFDHVRSWSRELDPVTHDIAGGVCAHRIAIDDGGLFEVEEHPEDDSRLIKIRVLRCHTSAPFQRPDGRWGTRNAYTIACPHGDTEYVHTWQPDGIRHLPDSNPKKRAPQDPIGWRLRPLSRADDTAAWYNVDRQPGGWADHAEAPRPFSDVYSRRNDAESYNQWYQQSLPHHGRATSLQMAAQELDFMLAAVLNNSITWANRR